MAYVLAAVTVLPVYCACCGHVLPTPHSWAAAKGTVIVLDSAVEAARLSRAGPIALGYEVTSPDKSVMASKS